SPSRRPPSPTLFPYTTLFRSLLNCAQRFLNQRFGLAVEVAGGFIQHQNTGVFQNHTCNSDTLFFAATEAIAAFTNDGVIAIRQRSEEHTSELQSRENLVCRLL